MKKHNCHLLTQIEIFKRHNQRSTGSVQSVFHRLGSPTDSLNGKANASS